MSSIVLTMLNVLGLKPYIEFTPNNACTGRSGRPWSQRTKISATEDEVCEVLLTWSELTELWSAHDLSGTYNFFADIVMLCNDIRIDVEDTEGSMAYGGIYTIFIDNPEAARNEMAEAVYTLVAKQLIKCSSPQDASE